MPDIHVRFEQGKPAFVYEDLLRVRQDEYVHWHFDTHDTTVAKVRITFTDPEAVFFPRPVGPPHMIEKVIGNGQTVWGRAPHFFACPPSKSRPDKYTIEAFDAGGNPLEWAKLDPTIRTEGP